MLIIYLYFYREMSIARDFSHEWFQLIRLILARPLYQNLNF